MAIHYYNNFTSDKVRRFAANVLGDARIWNDLQIAAAALYSGLSCNEYNEVYAFIYASNDNDVMEVA